MIAGDFYQVNGVPHLVLYDVFSMFPFAIPVRGPSAAELIRGCRAFFQFTGCPGEFWADQGTAFQSAEFQHFLFVNGTRYVPSSAEYPQSNGAAEAAVKIMKRLRLLESDENRFLHALLFLQNTAKPGFTATPAEVFLGRTQRTPVTPTVKISTVPWAVHRADRLRRQRGENVQYDRHSNARTPPFFLGQRVMVILKNRTRRPAIIIAHAAIPRAFEVQFETGHISIRNSRFLLPLPSSRESMDVGARATRHRPGRLGQPQPLGTPPDLPSGSTALSEPRLIRTRVGRISRPPTRFSASSVRVKRLPRDRCSTDWGDLSSVVWERDASRVLKKKRLITVDCARARLVLIARSSPRALCETPYQLSKGGRCEGRAEWRVVETGRETGSGSASGRLE